MTFGVLAAVAAAAPASDDVTPGVLAFLVVAAMGVALVFLLRSMNKQFRKIEPKTEGATGSEPGAGFEGTRPGPGEASAPEAPK